MPIRPEMRSRYPKDWKVRSRFIRHVRARNHCEARGVKNGTFLNPHCCAEPIWDERGICLSCGKRIPRVILTTAHVYDHRPEAASLLNLAAWCQRCHNRHDAIDRVRRRRTRIEKETGQMHLFQDYEGLLQPACTTPASPPHNSQNFVTTADNGGACLKKGGTSNPSFPYIPQ